jgi:hypothetical protein
MRLSFAALLPLFLAFSLPANAGGLDMMTITCSELASADKSQSEDDHFGAAVMLSWGPAITPPRNKARWSTSTR